MTESNRLAPYSKAIAAAAVPALLLLIGAWFIVSPHVMTDGEWAAILTAVLGGGGATYAAPKNAPKRQA